MFKILVNGLLGQFGYAIRRTGLEAGSLAHRCAELQDYAASLERSSQDLARRNEELEARIRSLSTDLEAERIKADFAMQRMREQKSAA